VSLVALVGVALASPAWAAFAPRFGASSNETTATITYTQAASDDAPAQIIFYVPVDYVADLGDVGFSVGKVTANAGSALEGTIDPVNATDNVTVGGVTSTVAQAATACTGTATHDGFWVLNLKSLTLPVFVDRVPTTDPLVNVAWFRLTMCPAADTKLTSLTLNLEGTTAGTPGWHPWFMKATPYTAGTTTRNTAGAVEVQSFDRSGPTVAFRAKKNGNSVSIVGRVTAGGNSKQLGGLTVTILDGTKSIGTAKTSSSGSFKLTVTTSAKRLGATATAAQADVATSCTSVTGSSCIAQTRGGFTATVKAVKVG